jgi:hypothetical protein
MDSERAKQIYAEIGKYFLQLDRDPGSIGPAYLNDQISTCRNYLNAVARIGLEVHEEKHNLSTLLLAEEAAYGVESADILANDTTVQKLPNIEDRKASIAVMLKDRSRRINELKAEIQNVDFVDKAVRHRHKELKDTMMEIRTQRSLMRDEIDTKSFYGDERTSHRGGGVLGEGSNLGKPSVLGIDDAELAAMFGSTGEPEPPVVSAVVVPDSVGEDVTTADFDAEAQAELDAIDSFLNEPTTPVKNDSDDADLASILANI